MISKHLPSKTISSFLQSKAKIKQSFCYLHAMLEKFYDDHHKNSGFEIKFICCISVVVFKLLHVYLLHVI